VCPKFCPSDLQQKQAADEADFAEAVVTGMPSIWPSTTARIVS